MYTRNHVIWTLKYVQRSILRSLLPEMKTQQITFVLSVNTGIILILTFLWIIFHFQFPAGMEMAKAKTYYTTL